MQFGTKPIFENVSVKFGEGHRYGLIGANGCGKSTFMKILSGELEPTSGSVAVDAGERVAKLNQDQFAFYGQVEMSEADGLRAGELEGRFAELDGYTAESRAGELLLGVGIPLELHSGPMSEVAPGYKLRVLLAQVLFAEPDIMLLDEPTNNLDINTIRWLEETLNARNSTMIIISHDRHFLNSVCTHIADVDYGQVRIYPGNYDEFMIASTQVRERLIADNAKKKTQIAELQQFVSRFSANASKARQATSRARQIEKIKLEDIKPSSRVSPFIRFEVAKPLRRVAVEVKNLSKKYDGPPLFNSLNLLIESGERLAIIGPNGIGKTTLLRTLIGEIKADFGTVAWAEHAKIGYFAQDHSKDFAEDLTLFDWMKQWAKPGSDDQLVRATLGRLLFSGDEAHKSVHVISGGEEGRMLFGKLLLQEPNVLVLDEPTNHLDMESIEALNLALENYKGTLFFVSHDREFVSSLATRILDMTPEGIIDYSGNYEDYLASRDRLQKGASPVNSTVKRPNAKQAR